MVFPFAPSAKQNAITAAQFFMWYVANSLYAVDTQQLLRSFDSKLLVLDLSFYQIIVGMAMAKIIMFRKQNLSTKEELPISEKHTAAWQHFFSITRVVGLLHLSATILTNFSYRIIGSTSTLAWKLTEPFSAVVLKRLILQESTPPVSFLGVSFVVAGVIIFSMKTMQIVTISPILLANILFPTRNVVMKLQQKNQKEHVSTEQRFYTLLNSCLPFCLFALLIKFVLHGPVISAIPYMLRNALLFNCYQFASIALLEKLDAVTHSLANTVKRVLGIVLSAGFLNEPFTERHFIGLLMAVLGFPLYASGGKSTREGNLRRNSLVACSLALILLFAYQHSSKSSGGSVQQASFRDSIMLDRNEGDRALQLRSSNSSTVDGSDFLIHVIRPNGDNYGPRLDKNNILAYRGGNVGNLVWQHAAFNRLPDFSDHVVCEDTFDTCRSRHSDVDSSKFLHYKPVSNVFNSARGSIFKFEVHLMNHGGVPLVIGVGLQAEFGEEDMNATSVEEQRRIAVGKFEHLDTGVIFLRLLQKRKTPMLVRGDVTLGTIQRVGYTYGISAGCPSLFLNRNVKLGELMEPKYAALGKRAGDKSLKIGINIQTEPRQLLDFFLHIFKEYPNSLIFAQGSNDAASLGRLEMDASRVRLYVDVEEWERELSEMDMVIGARIHGSMLALGVSVPVFVIAPDYRVLELVQRMEIPHMTSYDERMVAKAFDVAGFVSKNGIKGKKFDENRCGIAKIYRETFGRYGFDVSEHVRMISEIC